MPTSEKVSYDCVVCREVAYGNHFGAMVCRACAAFFRRSVVMSLQYTCKTGGNCPVDKSSSAKFDLPTNSAIRSICRSCRMKKCVEVGMRQDSIQLNRDPLKPERRSRSQSKERTRPMELTDPSLLLDKEEEPTDDKIFKQINAIFEYPVEGPNLLAKMVAGYDRLLEKRPIVYKHLMYIKKDKNATKEENMRRVQHNASVFTTMCKQEIDLIADLVVSFEPFIHLPPIQRWLLFKNYWHYFKMLERAFDTIMNYGKGDQLVAAMENGQTVDFFHVTSQLFSAPSLDDDEIDSLCARTCFLRLEGIHKPLIALQPSKEEIIATCGFMLWMHPGSPQVEAETLSIARRARSQISRDLQAYYEANGIGNQATERVAELMSIVSIVQKTVVRKQEDLLVMQLFDNSGVSKPMYEMYRS